MRSLAKLLLPAFVMSLGAACGDSEIVLNDDQASPDDPGTTAADLPFTSDVATLMDFEFDGQLTTNTSTNSTGAIRAQMMFMVGHINGEGGVARLNKLALTKVTTTSAGGGLYKVTYHAVLPVAWGSKTNLPTSYTLNLPKRVDSSGQTAFMNKYKDVCNDGEPQDVTLANYWYHYRPFSDNCSLDAADILAATATVSVDLGNSTSKYPEYQKIWEDNAFNVVAVFAKYTVGATTNDDAGIDAYNKFIAAVRDELPGATTVPASVLDTPGVAQTDITFRQVQPDGTTITVTAILIDGVTAVGASFTKRFNELTPGADMILYNGHAGLGANVAALSREGKWFPGKYQIFFMNGCDTFAYTDPTLATIRAPLNPDDNAAGTKYMDLVLNAMPAYFSSMPDASMAFIDAAINYQSNPLTYTNIFHSIDPAQIVVVLGEEDNVFGTSYYSGVAWDGIDQSGTVGKSQTVSYSTGTLPAGKYAFELMADPMRPGGDADLRVRVGAAPTITSTYKCPSYVGNSNEKCATFTLTSPSNVYIAVTGDATGVQSPYFLHGYQLPR
jgi:hypothetical protein